MEKDARPLPRVYALFLFAIIQWLRPCRRPLLLMSYLIQDKCYWVVVWLWWSDFVCRFVFRPQFDAILFHFGVSSWLRKYGYCGILLEHAWGQYSSGPSEGISNDTNHGWLLIGVVVGSCRPPGGGCFGLHITFFHKPENTNAFGLVQ